MSINEENRQDTPQSGISCAGGCCCAVNGGILGVIGGLILPPLYYQFTDPSILQDGQWGLVYLLTLPGGFIVGAIIGGLIGLLQPPK